MRQFLPEGTVQKPAGIEIRLLDLATRHSGLPRMPNNLHDGDVRQTFDEYHADDLYAYLSRRGVRKGNDVSFNYSNLGFALLGKALANRAGVSYPDLIRREVIGPLGLRDTVVVL